MDRMAVLPDADAFSDGCLPAEVWRFDGISFSPGSDTLIEEVPVSFEYDGKASIVMMATPLDLEAFALGFSLTEGIIERPEQILELDIVPIGGSGIAVIMRLEDGLWHKAQARKRDRVAGSSCSLCGLADMHEATRIPARVEARTTFGPSAIINAFEQLPRMQRLGSLTGSAHAAAFADASGAILDIAEDAGRHNALDKLVGKIARKGIAPASGFVAITSRASFEMVQKAAAAGFPMLGSISAPTGLATRMAREAGVTLCSFARQGRFACFAHPERIV